MSQALPLFCMMLWPWTLHAMVTAVPPLKVRTTAPLVLGCDGGVRTLPSTGLCLGMLADMAYEEGRETLAPGEVMILYTDGLSESRNAAKEEYGSDRLADVCRARPQASARELRDAIFHDLEAFTSGSPAADDRTLVIVRRLA